MQSPDTVDIGNDLYMRAWEDPNRPRGYTVAQWVRELLNQALPKKEENS